MSEEKLKNKEVWKFYRWSTVSYTNFLKFRKLQRRQFVKKQGKRMISPPSDDVVVDVEKGIVALPLGRPPTPRTIDFTLHGLVWRTRCYWDQSKRNVVFNLTCSPENYSTFWTVKSKVEIFLKLKHEEALPSSVEHLFDVSAKGIQMTCTAENLSLDVVRGWTGHGTIPPWFIEIRLIVKIGILSMHGQS
ncbi:unnamed protein product [Caenorhabditis auriculariae]|uniref:Uncharacterized protein n=1 Tax=Caenorhabditis auriculariae TaxID=2777116 RepID=A0A8S1HB57_9PELO|nr:unnamed protein product [Caenorhabditis auriculariae]